MEKRGTSAIKHSPVPKAAPTLPKSIPVSCIRVSPASPSKNGTLPSSQAIPTRDSLKSSVVSTRRAVSETTHHAVETRTRVSSKAVTPRFGKIPSVDSIERSDDRSDAIIGPAVEQALTLFSSEVGERRRVPDTVVSIHNGEKRDVCSPSPKTTRKWSNPSYAPARVDGGGQLARAAAYIRERATRRSPAFDEFVCRTPKGPPDRMTESESKRQPTLLAVSKIEMSAYMHSPTYHLSGP